MSRDKLHVPDFGSVDVIDEKSLPDDARKLVVCLRDDKESAFTDNVKSVCADCGHGVWIRPHWSTVPNVTAICMECMPNTEGLAGAKMAVTNRVRDEVERQLKKKMN